MAGFFLWGCVFRSNISPKIFRWIPFLVFYGFVIHSLYAIIPLSFCQVCKVTGLNQRESTAFTRQGSQVQSLSHPPCFSTKTGFVLLTGKLWKSGNVGGLKTTETELFFGNNYLLTKHNNYFSLLQCRTSPSKY